MIDVGLFSTALVYRAIFDIKVSITNSVLENCPQKRITFFKKIININLPFYTILCNQKLGISCLSILIMSNVHL